MGIASSQVDPGSALRRFGGFKGFGDGFASEPFALGKETYRLRKVKTQGQLNSREEVVPASEAPVIIERAARLYRTNLPLLRQLEAARSMNTRVAQRGTIALVRLTPLRVRPGRPTDPAKEPVPNRPSAKPKQPRPCATDFLLSPCRIVNVKGSLQIAASESGGAPAGEYEWTTSSTKITLENATSSTVTVKALDHASAGREAEAITVTRKQDGCPPIVKVAKVTVAKVTLSAAANQRFGHDNFDTPANPLDDHICIKKSDYTLLHVKIEGGAVGTDFNFVCDDAALCTPVAPAATAEFDLRLNAAAENKKDTVLHAKVKCPAATSFAHILVHVYKEREVDVVVAKFDKTTAGTNLRFPTADYAAHATKANAKLKEAVVKYNITNFDSGNAVTPVTLAGGAATVTYDIKAGGGTDLTAIGTAMTGTGTKVRVAIVRDMKSVYYLSASAAVGDTSLVVTADSTYFQVGNQPPVGTERTRRRSASPPWRAIPSPVPR